MSGTTFAMTAPLFLASLLAVTVAYSNTGPGTTPNITEILHGRCEEYRLCLHGDPCMPSYGRVNCANVVTKFMMAIEHVDPCYTPDDAFDTFLGMVPPQTRTDQTMFWSGVSGASVHLDIAQVTPQWTVLEETFAGYMAGNLSWCGSTDPNDRDGLNFTVCPTWTDESTGCPNNTKAAFWNRASGAFAKQAKGRTFVVLNSQRNGGAFKNDSVFASIESKNLNPAVVTNVAIYLLPDFTLETPNTNYRETCKNGTVLYMQRLLTDMGLNHTCESDPDELMWLQCARYPDNSLCKPYSGGGVSLTPLSIGFVLLETLLALAWST